MKEKELTKRQIANLHRQIEEVRVGKVAPGRVWQVTKRPDGTFARVQLDPEKVRQERAAEAAAEEALALTARRKLGVSQDRFAAMLGISAATLRNWEQRRRNPSGAAELLLRIAAENPAAVLAVTQG